MTTGDALPAAIWERPHDDLPRLAYADWLDDQGNASRAEFIRVQCELARRQADEPPADDPSDAPRLVLATTAARLAKKHGMGWRTHLPARQQRAKFHRGFPAPGPTPYTTAQFRRLPPDAFDAALLWSVRLAGGAGGFANATRHPEMAGVGALDLSGSAAQLASGLAGLRDSTAAPNLTDLTLTGPGGSFGGLVDTVAGPSLPRLSALTVGLIEIAAGELAAMLAGRGRPLRSLNLSQCGLTDFALTVLAESLRCDGLRAFTLLHCRDVTDAGVRSLAAAGWLAGVRMLELGGLTLAGDAAAEALADSPHVGNVKYLSPGGSRVGVAGATALARSDTLRRLHTLVLPRRAMPAYDLLRTRYGDSVHFER